MPVTVRSIAEGGDATPASLNDALNDLANAIEDREDGTVALPAPQISSFANAIHDHEDNAGGGQLGLDAINASGRTDGEGIVVDGGALVFADPTGIPPGVLVPFASLTAPAGWLLCDGRNVSRATYAALFAVVGTEFGNGDGSTTFGLPDMRGRVPVGMDDMNTGAGAADVVEDAEADTIGGSGGSETVTLTEDEMPAHGHGLREDMAGAPADRTVFDSEQNIFRASGGTGTVGSGDVNAFEPVIPAGGGMHHENMPPWRALPYIIKT